MKNNGYTEKCADMSAALPDYAPFSYQLGRTFAILLAVYFLVDYALIPGNSLFSAPVHHDDFTNFARSFKGLQLFMPRPVSYAVVTCLSNLGEQAYYLTLNALSVFYAALVFQFCCRILNASAKIADTIIFGGIVFSFPFIVEYAKYTGLITNLLSAIFSLLTLLFIQRSVQERDSRIYTILAIASYFLSIFSKEDFVLPPMLYLVVLVWKDRKLLIEKRGLLFGLVSVVVLSAAWYVVFSPSAFLGHNQSGTYASSFAPVSLVMTAARYLAAYPYGLAVTILFAACFVVAYYIYPAKRWELLFIFSVVFLTVLPYSALPNHFYLYYSYSWVPWQAMLIVGSMVLLRSSRKIVSNATRFISVIVMLSLVVATQGKRTQLVRWYHAEASKSRNILESLEANRLFIGKAEMVGIIGDGVATFSPWSKTDGRYLEKRGFNNRWVLFAEKSDIFNEINPDNKLDPKRRINVLGVSELSHMTSLPLLEFDRTGRGSIISYRERERVLSERRDKFILEVERMLTRFLEWKVIHGDYRGLTGEYAMKNGMLSADMVVNSTFVSPWAGPARVEIISKDRIALLFSAIPMDVCREIVRHKSDVYELHVDEFTEVLSPGSATGPASLCRTGNMWFEPRQP